MAAKRKRRRRPAARQATAAKARTAAASSPPGTSTDEPATERSTRTAPPARAGRQPAAAPTGPSHPPFGISMARGLWATATSPPLIVTCFLAVLVMWAAFTAFLQVFTVSPAAMVWFLALPPIHSFLELQSLSAIGQSPILAVVFGGALVVVQAYLFGMWIALIDGALHGRRQDWSAARDAARTAAGHLQTMIGIEAGFLALVVLIRVLDVLFVGLGLGLLGAIVAMSAGLYFLIFAPVAVIHDGLGIRDAVRASVRGARLPGSRHVVLTFGYVIVALLVQSTSATTRVSPATPSILTWAYVLLVNFLNLTVVAAFVYRWLIIRPLIEVEGAGEASPGRRPWLSRRPSTS